ncbi:MAG TPA: AMP-binding protein, partial [Candidatus Angelobacter sp.]|nr:AMP-binding protein [Candidatus Angelobacter sp.]
MNKSGALLSDAERQQVSYEWNRTQAEYPKNVCIHELFEAQVKRTPEATAVVFGDERISYSELNRRANRWANYLRMKGIKPEKRVGICIERSVEMVVGLLAILKAGGAYVLLDLSYPEERLQFILEDSAPVALLARNDLLDLLRGVDERVHVIDLSSELVFKDLPETNLDRTETGVDPECLACVIYTSGSTGKPKGSEIPHRSIPGFFLGVDYVRFDEETVSLQHSSVSWDAMMLELWPALLKGGRSVLAYQRILSAEDVRKYVQEDGINTLWLTAAQFNAIVESDVRCLEGLKYLMTGGEAASVRHIRRVKEELPGLRVVNGYGPSECTVFSSCY